MLTLTTTIVGLFLAAVKYLRTTVKKVIKHRQEKNLQQQGNILIDDILEFGPSEEVVECDTLTYMIGASHTTANCE